ncbi:MAG: hypothetical protein GPJ54_19630 [Candidatus Heimdallarchaeota archaeon]|nr:hypothetical protein [Candidatus Heimdallarchaeota archaeon]
MANRSLLFDHYDTGKKVASIPYQEFVMELDKEHQLAVGETNNNLNSLKSNISSQDLINRMLLPEESLKSQSLYVNILSKKDSLTGSEYERRYGVNIIQSNKRTILTDIDLNNTPTLEKIKLPSNNFATIDTWKVGHKISESIYFQPINFSNIFSVTLDVQSSSEANRAVTLKRHQPLILLGIVAAILGAIIEPFTAIIGLLMAAVGWFYLKQYEKGSPYTYSGQTRIITLGVVDPMTLKRAYWNLVLPNEIHPDQMINWVSMLQNKIYELHGMQKSQFVFNP